MVEGEYHIDGGVGQPYAQSQIFPFEDGRGDNEDADKVTNDGVSARTTSPQKDTGATGLPVQYVALRVQSNHGHEDYTCMYRFKVHGQQQQQP